MGTSAVSIQGHCLCRPACCKAKRTEEFDKLCCAAGSAAFGARICTASAAPECESDANGKTIFNANVTIGADKASITVSATGIIGSPTFVDFGQTDFPQCSVVNTIGAPLG